MIIGLFPTYCLYCLNVLLVNFDGVTCKISSVPSITLPTSKATKTVKYPAQIQEINIVDKPNLKTITIDGTNYLQSVTARRNSDAVAKAVIDILEQLNN